MLIRGQCTHSTRRITVREGFMADWPYVVTEKQVITISGNTLYIELSHQEGSPVYQEAVADYQRRKSAQTQAQE